jgi:hypothetical protein
MSMAMKNRYRTTVAKSQTGFALMMVMFMTTVLLVGAMIAAPYIRTERQREKEEEMIWRGKQYVRGIKLYYRKTGRFPTSVDDLTKPKLGSLRFMRQAYKDPMNKGDGAWRFIYVGPSGQLVGSLKPPQTFQMPAMGTGQPGTTPGGNPQQLSFGASGFGQSPPAQVGSQPGQQAASQTAAAPGQPGSQAQTSAPNATPADDAANATPSGMLSADTPLLGGNIIGVGSKINRRSVIVYDKAKNYRLFEFVWNPSKDMANALNQQLGNANQSLQGTGKGAPGFGPQNNTPTNTPEAPPPADMPLPTPPPEPVSPPPQ